MEGEKVHLPMI